MEYSVSLTSNMEVLQKGEWSGGERRALTPPRRTSELFWVLFRDPQLRTAAPSISQVGVLRHRT